MEIENFLNAFEFPKEAISTSLSIEYSDDTRKGKDHDDGDGDEEFREQSKRNATEIDKEDAAIYLGDDPEIFLRSVTTNSHDSVLPIERDNEILSRVYYIPECFEEPFLEVTKTNF